ncbi:MAG: response regulator [Azoarcus sp.]|jgi:two-component system response regulator DctR|nr:response regulator [Azoarcus sp.]
MIETNSMTSPFNKNYAHIIDDDEAICDALAWQFRTRKVDCKTWAKAEDFLDAWQPDWSGCVVLDIRLAGMSGLECFDSLIENHCPLPVIFITGHGDIPMAVEALKKGAFDFVEKPFNHNILVERVQLAFDLCDERRRLCTSREVIAERMSSLTSRELSILNLVLDGHYNKTIASTLAISMRTVEAHRSRIFSKMGVRSAVELAQLLADIKQ